MSLASLLVNRPDDVLISTTNPRVKRLVALRDRKTRDREECFVIEGVREVGRFLDAGRTPTEAYAAVDSAHSSGAVNELVERCRALGCLPVLLGEDAFAKVSYRERPEGILVVAQQWSLGLDSVLDGCGPEPLLLVAEQVEKPGNLGTLMRCADGAGAAALIVCDPVVDVFNPNVVRNSTGVLFRLPVAKASSEEVLSALQTRCITSVAFTPTGAADLWDVSLVGAVALVFGAEHDGLSPLWLAQADALVTIPMAGHADSLNVAMAATVGLFEACRQRSLNGR